MGKALGEQCAEATECASGFCADTVCCESACDGTCQSCGSDGTCTPYAPGTDPETECAPGVCDGASLCAKGDHIWSKSFGTNGGDTGAGVATDAQGNVYFEIVLGGTSPVNFGGTDITGPGTALVKFNAAGNHVWSTLIGDAKGTMHVTLNGELVLAGDATGTVTCGGDGTSSSGMSDVLLMRFDAPGTCVFAESWGDADIDSALGAASTVDGTIVVGRFEGSLNFGTGALVSAGGTDAFIAKFNSLNQVDWRIGFGGSGDDDVRAVAVAGNGTLLVVGAFEGSITVGTTNLTSHGGADVLVAAFDAGGAPQWAKGFGGAGDDGAVAAAIDANGSLVLAGLFGGPTISFGGATLNSAGGPGDMFVAKLDASGGHLFSAAYGGTSGELPTSLALDKSGSLVVTGFFDGSFSFGGDVLTSAGFDVFAAKFAGDGTHLWSKRFGDPEPDFGWSVAMDPQGNVLLAGTFTSTIGFGGNVLTSVFSGDAFIAKLGP